MEKSKKHYWGIVNNGEVVFGGSFAECWKQLVAEYGDWKVSNLEKSGISIKRTN